MGVETVVIKITGDSKDLNKTIDQLEKLGKVDRQNSASFKKTSEQNQKSIKKTESAVGGLQKQVLSFGATLIGAFAIQQVASKAFNILKDFEKELSTLQSITGSAKEEMEFFSEAAIEIGRATKTSATEVVKAFTLIGSAQPELLKNKDALADVTEQALILSKAAGIDTVAAAQALTGAMNQFGASAKDAAKFTDIFATSQQKGSSFINATAEALKNSGAAANAAGVSFETTNAAIQALAKGSILGGEAGTALRGILIKLSSQADKDINPSMVGLGKTIETLAKRNLSLADATKLVGQEGATGLLTLITQIDTFQELDGTLNDTGNALEQMRINTDNLEGSLDDLSNEFENFVLSLKESDGILRTVVDLTSSLFRGLSSGEFAQTRFTKATQVSSESLREALILFEKSTILRGKEIDLVKRQEFITAILAAKLREQAEAQEEVNDETEDAIEDQKDLSDADGVRAGTIGALREELKKLREAQNDMIPGSKELAVNQDRIREIQALLRGEIERSLAPIDALTKRIGELRKELLNQALAGGIVRETLEEYQKAVMDLSDAQVELMIATRGANELIAAQKLELDDVSKSFETAEELIKGFNQIQRDEAQATADARVQSLEAVLEAEMLFSRIISQSTTNRIIELDNETKVREVNLLKQFQNGKLTEEQLADAQDKIRRESDSKRSELLTEQAENDKIAAIIAATINTAIAVTKALATGNVALATFVGILGSAEVALIASQPTPKFHEGKKSELGSDEIPAIILKSESVIPPNQSKQNKGLIDSIIDDNLSSYVFKHYQLPLLEQMSSTSNLFDDQGIVRKQRTQISLMQENNELLKSLKPSLRRQWR